MHRPQVRYHYGAFWDRIGLEVNAPRCHMGDGKRNGRSYPHDLVDGGVAVRKIRTIGKGWLTATTNYGIQLIMHLYKNGISYSNFIKANIIESELNNQG